MNLPVPRSLGSKKNVSKLVSPLEEVFSIPSPNSGYALKLIKQFKHLWVDHYKGKLISKPTKIELILTPNIPATKKRANSFFILGSSSVTWWFNLKSAFFRPVFKGRINDVKTIEKNDINNITFRWG